MTLTSEHKAAYEDETEFVMFGEKSISEVFKMDTENHMDIVFSKQDEVKECETEIEQNLFDLRRRPRC